MGSSCAQSASQNHILLRQFTIYFNSTLNFKGLKILGTRRNDISVVFTMGQVLEEFLLMGKIRESLEEVGDDCRLEFNPDFTKFLCDLLPTWLEREIQYTVEATSSPECVFGQTLSEAKRTFLQQIYICSFSQWKKRVNPFNLLNLLVKGNL